MKKCSKCGEDDLSEHYKSGKMRFCKNCQRYSNLVSNSKVKRKRGKSPKVLISEIEFMEWVKSKPKVCFYCGISEEQLGRIEMTSNIGLRIESLGVDRLDSHGDYEIGNIELCCFVCNRVKSAFFSSEEMSLIGSRIGMVWQKRMSTSEFAKGGEIMYDDAFAMEGGSHDKHSSDRRPE